ncbi:MAG TPA: hypothetical protein DCY20_05815, partial [Firmicutes bacterium]|nr:hypothetical protein [Bacillota bacterium]
MATLYTTENYYLILFFSVGITFIVLLILLGLFMRYNYNKSTFDTIILNSNIHALEKYLQKKHPKQKLQYTHASAIAFKIGNLNKINQTFGFDIGDLLMISFSHRIKNSLQILKINHFFSMIRDNTFLLIVYGLTETEVTTYIENLFTQLETPYQIKQYQILATPIAGILPINDKNDLYVHKKLNLTNLLLTLEMAREDYKYKHKASYCVFTEMIRSNNDVQKERFFELENAIKNGEFEPFYQPIISAMSNNVISLEALCRWNHPEKGYLSPYFFLNDIMNFGLTSALDYTILKQALSHLKVIHTETNVLVPVSVNFTIDTILEENFVSTISKIIQEVNIDPSYLIIEITEHSFIKQVDVINNKI